MKLSEQSSDCSLVYPHNWAPTSSTLPCSLCSLHCPPLSPCQLPPPQVYHRCVTTTINSCRSWQQPPPGQPAAGGQAPVAVPADVKAMGGLPAAFDGDRLRVDDFIEEVKGFLWLNQDVAGYNSPVVTYYCYKSSEVTMTYLRWR